MFERRNIKYIYLKLSRKIKDFLLSDKSREFSFLLQVDFGCFKR